VAKIAFREGLVERGSPEGSWTVAEENTRIRTGDRIRTGTEATARVEFPFMNVVVGGSSILGVAASQVLATSLETGRVEEHAEGADAIKLRTAEALLRGRGRVVVRREATTTFITVWEGRFLVEASGHNLVLKGGSGTIVESGRVPTALSPPAPPADPKPGSDTLYLGKGEEVSLDWHGPPGLYHVQVLGFHSDEVLLERETQVGPVTVRIPWLGTFRWHVSIRGERGLESLPSREGSFCVIDR
jgi:hypothetical protein